MKWHFFRFLFLLTMPGMTFPSLPSSIPLPMIEELHLESQLKTLNYDDILALLESIEKGELDERYTRDHLDKIAEFVAMLAENGIPSDDALNLTLFQQDKYDLLNSSDSNLCIFTFDIEDPYLSDAQIHSTPWEIHLCKQRNWFSRQYRHIAKFVKKHKKEIIIGAVVVVAAVAVTVAVVSMASTSAVASAAATAGAAAPAVIPHKNGSSPSESQSSAISTSSETEVSCKKSAPETPFTEPVVQAIEANSENIKSTVVRECAQDVAIGLNAANELSLIEKARNIGAFITHETLDAIANIVEPLPNLLSEIKDLGLKILPAQPELCDPSRILLTRDPLIIYQDGVSSLHDKIDQAFNTDYAYRYTEEYKTAAPGKMFSIGFLPPPGLFNAVITDLNTLSNAGKAFDRGGFTKAGRGLMKHGYRTGSVFPKPTGTPAQINEHGQKILDMILNHPQKTVVQNEYKRYGKIVDIIAPGLGGVRYDIEGNFIGFLEP